MTVPLNGLVAYYEFEEASGTRFDSISTHDLSEVGSAAPYPSAPGIIGNAVQMPVPIDGNARLETPDDPVFKPGTGSFTLAGWAFIETKITNFQPMLSKGRLNGFDREYFVIYDGTGSDRFEFAFRDGLGSTIFHPSSVIGVPLNTWTFVVAWQDSATQTMNIQVNNGVVDSLSNPNGIAATTRPFVVGGHVGGLFGWPGRVDEVGVWSRVLTSAERTSLYNGGAGSIFVPPAPTVQTIDANTTIDRIETKDFSFNLNFTKETIQDFEENVVITQTVPVAPTLLTVADLLTGDKVRLVWTGGGPFYNVFFKKTADITFIKANQTTLPGSQTQYDVGGLERDVSYDFQVSSINGAGVETL